MTTERSKSFANPATNLRYIWIYPNFIWETTNLNWENINLIWINMNLVSGENVTFWREMAILVISIISFFDLLVRREARSYSLCPRPLGPYLKHSTLSTNNYLKSTLTPNTYHLAPNTIQRPLGPYLKHFALTLGTTLSKVHLHTLHTLHFTLSTWHQQYPNYKWTIPQTQNHLALCYPKSPKYSWNVYIIQHY